MADSPLASIPTNLVTGRRGAGKSSLILHALSLRPRGARWAVLLNDADAAAFGNGDAHTPIDGIAISEVAEGCICCTAQLPLRTALNRLLRTARPERLLIEASTQARTSDLLRLLADRWLAPVLSLRATLCVIDPAQFEDCSADAIYAGQISRADVAVINRTDLAGTAQIATLEHHLAQLSPIPFVAKAMRGAIDPMLLDLPATRLAARFHGSESGIVSRE